MENANIKPLEDSEMDKLIKEKFRYNFPKSIVESSNKENEPKSSNIIPEPKQSEKIKDTQMNSQHNETK